MHFHIYLINTNRKMFFLRKIIIMLFCRPIDEQKLLNKNLNQAKRIIRFHGCLWNIKVYYSDQHILRDAMFKSNRITLWINRETNKVSSVHVG